MSKAQRIRRLPKKPSNYLNCFEVADQLGVSPTTVQRWCARRKIPGAFLIATKTGWRIPPASLERFVASMARRTQSTPTQNTP